MNKVLVSLGLLFVFVWLGFLFLPNSPTDTHGYDRLWSEIVFSSCHILVGLALLLFAYCGVGDLAFALSILAAPFFHIAASTSESVGSIVLMLLPAALTFYLGIRSLRSSE